MVLTKAVFFDLDDTLHDFKRASGGAISLIYEKIASRHGIDRIQLKVRYEELLRQAEEYAFLDGRSSTDYRLERVDNLLRTFGIKDEKFAMELVQLYGEELEKRLNLFPDVVPLLERLQEQYKLYIVTEGPSDAQQHALEVLGIRDYFTDIFISGEVKKIKSTGELFRHAIKESGYSTQDIVLVGDSYKRDVVGGLTAGLRVIWLNRKNEKIETTQPTPYREIRDLNELEGRLKRTGPILILGHPRSGTNFVSVIFRSHSTVNLLIEPFSQHSQFFSDNDFVLWKRTAFDRPNFHATLSDKPEAIAFLRDFKRWLYFDTGEIKAFKETAFFLQLEWLKEYLPDLRIVYIERDLQGVVSSFKKSDFFNRWNYEKRFQALVEQVTTCKDLEEYRPIVDSARGGSWIEQLTVMWYIRTRETRKKLQLFDHIIFKYEDLAANPELQFTEMFRFAGLEMNKDVKRAINERCKENRGGEFSTFRVSRKVADEWKQVLSNNEKRIVSKHIKSAGDVKHEKCKWRVR